MKFYVTALIALADAASSFTVTVTNGSMTQRTQIRNTHRNELFPLFGRKKKGNLVLGGDDYDLRSSMLETKTKTKTKAKTKANKGRGQKQDPNNNNNSNKKGGVVKVSSSLSEWAATQNFDSENSSSSTATSTSMTIEASSNNNVEYSSFTDDNDNDNESKKSKQKSKKGNKNKNKKNNSNNQSRRERDMQLQKLNQAYTQQINSIIDDLKEIISSNNFNVQSLLSLIDDLIVANRNFNTSGSGNGSSSTNDSANESLKQLFKKNNSYKFSSGSDSDSISIPGSDYTLAWVGSDNAICHLGTGLHNVPLARLQDIFVTLGSSAFINDSGVGENNNNNNINNNSGGADEMSLMGGKGSMKKQKKNKVIAANRNSITVMEVIRILGPFPNVRNTLQGKIEISSGSGSGSGSGSVSSSTTSTMGIQEQQQQRIMKRQGGGSAASLGQDVQITYNSMMDGLGKEIQAGNDGDVRTLGLTILFADEDAVVAVVPKDDDDGDNDNGNNSVYGANGENVLLFLKESDLDAKLNGLRAS